MLFVWAGAILTGCSSEPKKGMNAVSLVDLGSAQVYSTQARSNIALPELYRQLRQADYVLLGELHDDPVHHELQRLLLSEIVRQGRKPAVVFEMFDRKDAGLIATAIRRSPLDPDSIAEAVDWEASGWPDWRFYRPIVETALASDLPIAAGNLSRAELLVLAFGAVWQTWGERTLRGYGLLQPLPKGQEQQLRTILMTAHHGDMSPEMVSGMLLAQRSRDASLAETMLAWNSGDGAVLITGREHARLDYGVPHYLRFREPDATIASVAFIDATDFDPSAAVVQAETAAHDYLWVLSATDEGTAHKSRMPMSRVAKIRNGR